MTEGTDASASAQRPSWLRRILMGVGALVVVFAAMVLYARSAMSSDTRLQVGDVAPDFTLPDQNGDAVTLSAVLESHQGAIVAFYPKDFTPG